MTDERCGKEMEEIRLGPERATFIVRLARARHGRSEWRGQVEYVQRGERRGVADLKSIFDQLQKWLNTAHGPDPGASPETREET